MKRCDGCTTQVTCEMHGCADPSSHPPTRNTSRDAERYRWLRERDVNAIHSGGLFVGMTPDNIVLNGDDLDIAIDAAMTPNPDRKN